MRIDKVIIEKYDDLPPGQQKVATYLVENPVGFSISTIAQIAKKVNISETTVIRLAYNIGFESFTHMQKELQGQFLNKERKSLPSSQYGVEYEEKLTLDNLFEKIGNEEIFSIKNIVEKIDQDMVLETVELLMEAEEVKIGGFLASYSAAYWLSLKLGMMRENVTLLSNESGLMFENIISNKKNKTVYFMISMPSYAEDTIKICRIAKEQGAKIIVLTDRPLSPSGKLADVCLTLGLGAQSKSALSVTAVMSYLNLIASVIEFKHEDEISDRVHQIRNMYSQEKIVIE